MFTEDTFEAAPIVNTTLQALLSWTPTRGRDGANLRSKVNDVRAKVFRLLQDDTIGQPIADCFDLAFEAGVSMKQIEAVRIAAASTIPKLVGAIMIRSSLIEFCLVTQSRILADMIFDSREDVENIRSMFNASFAAIEEDLADRMDAMTYRAAVELHAAVSFYLVETARPLPRLLRYKFNQTLPTLAIAQRLYYNAERADEVRKENKIIHPAFAPLAGIALSN